MTASLIDNVLEEMNRVWGSDGFHGTSDDYIWLLEHYGITEEEDVQWQLILQHSMDDLPDEDRLDPEVMQFVEDERLVASFLRSLLHRYKSCSAVRTH